jgi:hypothetical protein
MAAFRKRNNKWQAQIRIKGQALRKKSFITKRDAESGARKVEAELEASAVRIDPRALERSTVRDLLERYQKEVTVAKRGGEGDTIVVTKLDRSVAHLLKVLEMIEAKGASFRILAMGIDTGTATGKLMLTLLGGVAEF